MKFDIGSMMEQVRKMQEGLEQVKQEGARIIVNGESGGGMIRVTMNSMREVLSVEIAEELMKQGDKKMLEDLMVAAFNKASENAQNKMNEEMGKISSMMPNLPNIPGLNLF